MSAPTFLFKQNYMAANKKNQIKIEFIVNSSATFKIHVKLQVILKSCFPYDPFCVTVDVPQTIDKTCTLVRFSAVNLNLNRLYLRTCCCFFYRILCQPWAYDD